MQTRLKTAFKIVFTLFFMWIILVRIDLSLLLQATQNISYLPILLAIVVMLIFYVLKVWKWHVLVQLGHQSTFSESSAAFLKGLAIGVITPGRVGELGRAAYLQAPTASIVPTIILDKIIDVLILSGLSCVFLLILYGFTSLVTATVIIIILAVGVLLCSMFSHLLRWVGKLLHLSPLTIHQYITSWDMLRRNGKTVFYSSVLGVIAYGVSLIIGVFILHAISVDIPKILVLIFPIITLLGNIPISISGLGVREGFAMYLFTESHMKSELGLLFSLLFFLITTVFPAAIGVILMFYQKKHVTQ